MFADNGLETQNATLQAEVEDLGLPTRFSVKTLIGQGGMSNVYRAYDSHLERDVAVKLLHADLALTADGQKRFLREARTLATLAHAHILKIHMFGIAQPSCRPFQISDFLEGESLSDCLARQTVLSAAEFESVFSGVLQALQYASSKGVVHRDIKPSNIFLRKDPDGLVVPILLDFGIAGIETGEVGKTATGTGAMLGSPLYMSPEQCRGEPVDTLSDVYSLGIVMYECLTGRPPFGGESALETMYQRMASSVPTLNSYLAGKKCQLALNRIVLSCLQKDKRLRPQSISLLRDELTVALNELPDGVVFSSGKGSSKRTISRLWLSAICTVTLLVACGFFAIMAVDMVRKQEERALVKPNLQADRDSLEKLEKIVAKRQHFFDMETNARKENSARPLVKSLATLGFGYWSAHRYEDWWLLTERILETYKQMANGKSRQVLLYIDTFHRCYQLRRSHTIKRSEKQKWIERAANCLGAAIRVSKELDHPITGVAVSHARIVDFVHDGRFRDAYREYQASWNNLTKAERSLGTELLFDGELKKDWRPERVRDTLEHVIDESDWKAGDDPLALCELIAPMAEYLNSVRDTNNCARAKKFALTVLDSAYPRPPVDARLVSRYSLVKQLLQPHEPPKGRDDFWEKNSMRPEY